MADVWQGKRIVILGMARQGKALARFAAGQGASVFLSDTRPAADLAAAADELSDLPLAFALGGHPLSLLDGADVLAVSGGVPLDQPIVWEARRRGLAVTNDSLEFMRRVAAPVVGITGSAGKTTTTALTGELVKTSGRRTWVGGNIGRPLIADLDAIRPGDVVVQELSSFQLELWDVSPAVAAVLNVTPNHLDRHKTMAAYAAAKANILRYQGPDGVAVLAAEDPGARDLAPLVRGRLRTFSLAHAVADGAYLRGGEVVLRDGASEAVICAAADIRLRGRHNVLNVLAAVVLADSVGAPAAAMREVIRAFRGVEHRLELVRTVRGVQYVNDSIATAPERAIAALESFPEPVILLAGGRDKAMVWDEWAATVQRRVKAVVLFGELAGLLAEKLAAARPGRGPGVPVVPAATLAEAVSAAAALARPGDVVLLAPGGTSYDAFADFAGRGAAFRSLVADLPA